MSTQRDFDRTTQAWLAEGPSELSDRVLDAALLEVHETRQARRRLIAPWRFSDMHLSARLLAPGLVAVAVAALGFAFVVGSPAPTPTGSPVATLSRTAPPPTPATVSCGHQLVPTLLMTVGCTYQSTVFVHPLTVTPPDAWLVGDDRQTAVSFRDYGVPQSLVEVQLIVLGSIDGGGCFGATTPLPVTPLPRNSNEYLAWLSIAAPGRSLAETVTVGGLHAQKVTIPAPGTDCVSINVGSTATGVAGSVTPMDCLGDPCTLYVIDDGGQVLLLKTVAPSDAPAAPNDVERFLGGLRLTP